jgi:DNA-binding CsgD family transcriptional regulator
MGRRLPEKTYRFYAKDDILAIKGRKVKSEYIDFILDKCPVGLILFDRRNISFSNKKANGFLGRFELPIEITKINGRIFDAIQRGRLGELFPGEISLTRKFDGSPSNWIFRIYICEKPDPLVYLVIIEETISNKLNINELRQKFGLTRRETDILKRVLDGLRNIEIAEELEIAEQTVKDHLSKVYKKIGVDNRTDLMRTLVYSSNNQT